MSARLVSPDPTVVPLPLPADPAPSRPLRPIPARVLRQHQAFQPGDPPYAQWARLNAALWARHHDLPPGSHLDRDSRRVTCGWRLGPAASQAGFTFLSDDLTDIVWDEIATPENTSFDQHRLLSDLLAPDALALNVFAPLRLDLDLATAVFRRLLPDPKLTVVGLHFERPLSGIGSGVFLRYRTGSGGRGFVLIQVLYTET